MAGQPKVTVQLNWSVSVEDSMSDLLGLVILYGGKLGIYLG
jgi:hypothetical protein